MYEQFWELDRSPFQNNTAPEFFYRSETHHAALLKLRYVIENRLGAGLLVGGIGYGKTYLAHMLAYELAEEFHPLIHIMFPQLTSAELLAYLAIELGADESTVGSGPGNLDRTVRQIEQQLTKQVKLGRHPVILIDDAHLIDDMQVFHTLQLLLNFEQRSTISFSLILIGEWTLLARVSRVAQLDERIPVKGLLQPLSKSGTIEYVKSRLEAAGAMRAIFDETALDALFELSGGVPRRINRLCDLALLVGYADELKMLTAQEIEAVSEELTTVVPV